MDATLRLLVQAIHVLGVLLWIGGLCTAALTVAAVPRKDRPTVAVAARRAVWMLATPGLLVAWLAGLAMLITDWGELFARAGWMHGKLLVALVATVVSGVVTGRLRKDKAGRGTPPVFYRASATALAVLAAAAVLLVLLRPG